MRSLSTRATIIARRCHPSFSYVLHNDDDSKTRLIDEDLSSQRIDSFLQKRSFGGRSFNNSAGFGAFFQDRRYSHEFLLPSSGPSFCRYMSTTVGGGLDKVEIIGNVAEVLSDTSMETVAAQAAAVNEVAIAAADSFLPVKMLQYFIDYVHCYTGLNWWGVICNSIFYF